MVCRGTSYARFLHGSVPPFPLHSQVQYSLLDRRVELGPMRSYCADKGIGLLAYGTVAGGLLNAEEFLGRKPSDVAMNTYSRRCVDVSLHTGAAHSH